jgi:hypothetical protein
VLRILVTIITACKCKIITKIFKSIFVLFNRIDETCTMNVIGRYTKFFVKTYKDPKKITGKMTH